MKTMRTVLFSWLIIAVFACPLYALSQQDTLSQYMKALQKNPYDVALRAEIIRHVETMNPPPSVPEAFHRHMSRGTSLMNQARSADEFTAAVGELEKAVMIAPWDAAANHQLGIAQDKAGMPYDAIKSLKLSILASPNAPNAAEVEALITSIVNRLEKK